MDVAIGLKRFAAVPDFPIVDIPAVRRTSDVIALRRKGADYLTERVAEQFVIVGFAHLVLGPLIFAAEELNLVVAAPQRDAWMVTQPQHIVASFLPHIFQKGRVKTRIGGATEFEIHPDADTQFVAGVKQCVVLIVATAPEPQRIHIHRHRILDVLPHLFPSHARRKRVERNAIGPFGKKWHSVSDEMHRLIAALWHHPQRSQSNPFGAGIEKLASLVQQLGGDRVKRLGTHPGWPPKLRRRHVERDPGLASGKPELANRHDFSRRIAQCDAGRQRLDERGGRGGGSDVQPHRSGL